MRSGLPICKYCIDNGISSIDLHQLCILCVMCVVTFRYILLVFMSHVNHWVSKISETLAASSGCCMWWSTASVKLVVGMLHLLLLLYCFTIYMKSKTLVTVEYGAMPSSPLLANVFMQSYALLLLYEGHVSYSLLCVSCLTAI